MIRLLLLSIAIAFAAAQPTAAATAAGAAPAAKVYVISIEQMAFSPAPPGLRAGDIVEWVNRDLFRHSATARDGRFDVELEPGASARTVVTRGTIDFHCKFHPNMTGVLKVD